jgi:hypothetical protein
MNQNRIVKSFVIGAGLFFLYVAPAMTLSQAPSPPPVQVPQKTSPLARPKREPSPPDVFAGLTYTEEQKAKIAEIHQSFKARLDAVAKDDKLSPEQREAMVQGFQLMERREVYKVLTMEQQREVRKRIAAERGAARAESQKRQPLQPQP